MKQLLPLIIAVMAGGVLPLQASLNVNLGKTVNQPVFAAFVSFFIGTVGLLIYLFAINFNFSSTHQTFQAHWSVWLAGLLGAFYVTAVIVLTPRIGTTLTFGLIISGQMLISLIIDQFGFMGATVHPINWQRIMGVFLLIGGMLLIRKF